MSLVVGARTVVQLADGVRLFADVADKALDLGRLPDAERSTRFALECAHELADIASSPEDHALARARRILAPILARVEAATSRTVGSGRTGIDLPGFPRKHSGWGTFAEQLA